MSLDGWVGDVTYVTVACKGPRRFFDLDAVRTEYAMEHDRRAAEAGVPGPVWSGNNNPASGNNRHNGLEQRRMTHAGAPPLDWHSDLEDGDWLWKLPTQPYKGSHYATFPLELPTRLIMAMCPLRVCTICGKPSERITEHSYNGLTSNGRTAKADSPYQTQRADSMNVATLGFTDCGHNAWRTGVVLDPFCGSGTTLQAAQNVGRHAIGIDLDETNADLARSRVGMYMTVDDGVVA